MVLVKFVKNASKVCLFVLSFTRSNFNGNPFEELDKASPNNWLDDNLWLKKAYHEWRAPLLVNSNWWLSLKYDTTVPLEVLSGNFLPGHDVRETGITRWQVRRASWMAWRVLDFKAQLERYMNTVSIPF